MAKLAEVATEVVEETAEGVADVSNLVAEAAREASPDRVRMALLGFGVGLGVGFVAGGFYVNWRLRTKYEAVAEDEILQMRDHFRAREVAREQKPALEKVIEEAGYAATEDPGSPNVVSPERDSRPVPAVAVEQAESAAERTRNVFRDQAVEEAVAVKDASDDWDYEMELANRSEDSPYVIHEDEQHEKDYTTETLTYYEADDVLVDVGDQIIENRDQIVGDAIGKWGHGSSDPSTVYVRNDRLGVDIELCRSRGSYAEDVHGIRHSDETFLRTRRRPHHDE